MNDFIVENLIQLYCNNNKQEERCLSINCFYDDVMEVKIRNWEGEISNVNLTKEQVESLVSHLTKHLKRLNEDKDYAERKIS